LCGVAARSWFSKSGRTVARCPSCRVVFVPEGLARTATGTTIYESDTPVFLAEGNENYYFGDHRNLAGARDKLEWVRSFLPGGGPLLDIGSGFGYFLKAASEHFRDLRYLHRGPLGWAAAIGRILPRPVLDRPIYVRLHDVMGVAVRRRG
jgi:hypothetical protein